jgi:ferrous iron transport protein A
VSIRDLQVGQKGRIVQVNARGAVRQRLLDMGLLPDVPVRLERLAPTGDPLWISLQGSQIALRRKEAESVLIVGD